MTINYEMFKKFDKIILNKTPKGKENQHHAAPCFVRLYRKKADKILSDLNKVKLGKLKETKRKQRKKKKKKKEKI